MIKHISSMRTHFFKCTLFILFFGLGSFTVFSQVKKNFEVRYEADIRGELTFVGNSIVGPHIDPYCTGFWIWKTCYPEQFPNDPYNLTGNSSRANDDLDMQYIDIDGDASTFSSSSATLEIPDISCAKVRYAGLYWSAVYKNSDRSNIDNIKFKVPGGNYQDITADEILFDGNGDSDFGDYSPYAAYKDVTSIVSSLANPNGEYFVANVRASNGVGRDLNIPGGISGGWNLVIVYENPNLPGSKFITTFDGYAGIKSAESVDIPISGFTTLPAPFPVIANMGVATLEGDNNIPGDGLSIDAFGGGVFRTLSDGENPANNFFNSSITLKGNPVTTRNPNSTNTLGWDLDLIEIPNDNKDVIPNGATSAVLRASSSQDKYDIFFTSFDVEIIAPKIVLEKKVYTPGGVDITGEGVHLGQVLDYVLTFQNLGNDDGTNYTIRDVLPVNVSPPYGRSYFIDSDFDLPDDLPEDVTYSYDPTTREVTFSVPDGYIEEGDPPYSIRMRVQVAENCFDFIDACSDLIQNLAYGTYSGVENSAVVTDDPSVTDFDACGFVVPGATNFLLDDLSDCNFTRTVELCGANALLDAGDGFDDYIWYRDNNGNGEIDPGDTDITNVDGNPDNDPSTILVDAIGTYIVDKIATDPCKGFKEIINVEPYGSGSLPHPIIEFYNAVNSDTDPSNDISGEIVTCSVDNDLLPKIFLCGIDDSHQLQVNIVDAQSIVWEKLDEGSCSPSGDDCANKALTCTWNEVGRGKSYVLDSEGQYRLSVTYQNGCTSRFYFNGFQNNLDIEYDSSDIICNTDGNITITNLGNGYGYQLVDDITSNILVPFSANNGPSFDFSTGESGSYRVEVTQLDTNGDPIDNACIFSTPVIGVQERDVTYAVNVTSATCLAAGSINIQINNAEPVYEYEIRLDDGSNGGQGTLVDNETAQVDNDFTFEGLTPGDYIAIVRTADGCSYSENVTIIDENDLEVTARVSQHISCEDGIITMESSGGVTPHRYAIWSYVDDGGNTVTSYASPEDIPSSEFQTSTDFSIADAGDYTFVVIDRSGCFAYSNTVTIEFQPPADFDPTTVTDVACFGEASGSIHYNLINDNGNVLTFTLLDENDVEISENGSGNFTNLSAGDYKVIINQSRGNISCDYEDTFTIAEPTSAIIGTAQLVQDYTCLQEGIIEVIDVSGGTAPYQYSIDGINFVPDTTPNANRFENLTDGSYTISIRDASGCVFTAAPIVIDAPNPPTDLTIVESQITCPAETVSLNVTAVDGTAPYTFEIIAPTMINPSSASGNTADFDGLSADTYTIRVTDADGCFYDENYTIAPIVPITMSGSTLTPVSCFGADDGSVQFTINYQTGQNFTYTVTGPSGVEATGGVEASINLSNLEAGDYTLDIVDTDTNCTYSETYTLEGPSTALTVSDLAVTQPTCLANGSVVITATGGWGSYEFDLTNPDGSAFGSNTTGAFSGLTQPGTYNGTITDANNCILPFSFVINSSVAPVLELIPNSFCYDDAVGLTITANVTSGGDGNFEYNINGGAFSSNNIFAGLSPGTYTIGVRDGKSCTATETITVNPELSVLASASPISACDTDTDIDITAAGGDGNYVYAVVADGDTPSTGDFSAANNPVSGITAGDYDVYVRDNNGNTGYCEAVYDITIQQDAPLAITVSNTPILCSGENQATITILASGGEAPYRYSIDNGASYQTANTFNNLGAGTYSISVRDVNNCEVTQTYNITEPFTLSASAAVTQLVECNPSDGAEVRVTNAQGGTAPYTYSFDGGSTYDTSAIGFLLPGTHTVYIKDANGCTYPMSVTIEQAPTPPNVTLTPSVDYSCEGTGIVTIAPDNPNLEYIYYLNGSVNSPSDSNVFTDVPVGTHTVRVDYISATPPAKSELLKEDFGTGPNVSIPQIDSAYYCYESQDASLGTCTDANFEINDLQYSVTNTIVDPFGTWVSPIDNSGDPNGRYLAINVGDPGVNTIVYSKTGVEIIPNRDVEVELDVINLVKQGTNIIEPNILVEIVDPLGNVIDSGTTGLISENTGPNDWRSVSIPPLDPGANSTIDIVIRTIATGTNGNDVAIDNIEAYQNPEQCYQTVTLDVTVEPGNAFAANVIGFTDVDCNGASNGDITFEVDNFGTGGYEYSLDDFTTILGSSTSSPATISSLSAGSYTIYIRDVDNPVAGCTVTINQTIGEPDAVVASASITQEYTCDNGGATITASATGGTPGYEYQLEDDLGNVVTGYQPSTTFNGVAAGDYIVRARDTNGCSDPIDTAITVVAPVTPVFTLTPVACYSGNNDGSIQVDVTAGNGDYQFSINSGPWLTPTPSNLTTYTFENLGSGTYTIDVRDGYGCAPAQQSVTLEPQLTAIVDVTNISNCADGDITVTATGGDGSYAYAFVPTTTDPTGLFGPSNSFTVTAGNEGTYDVYVRDNSASTPFCEYMETVVVEPAVPLTFTATPTDPICHDGFGSIEVDITSGNIPYTVQIIDLDNGGASNETLTNVLGATTNFYNLAPGNYTINVSDPDGCMVSQTPVNIANPDELTADFEAIVPSGCDPDPNQYGFRFINYPATLGTLEFSADGGASWQSSDTFVGVAYASGTEVDPVVRVVGTNCRLDLTRETIPYPLDDLNIHLTANLVSCNNLEVTVQGTEGLAPYQYTYTDDPANFDAATATWTAFTPGNHVYSNLVPGRTYVFYARDSSPCMRQSSVNVNDVVPPPVQIDAEVTPTCDGLSNGQITYTVTEDTPGELGGTFDWDFYRIESTLPHTLVQSGTVAGFVSGDSFVVPTPASLPEGDYYVEIRGAAPNNCIIGGENVRVRELDPITYTPNVLEDITCADPGIIEIQNIQGGGGTYNYTLSSGNFTADIVSTSSPIEVPISNIVDVTASPFNIDIDVTDQYGCTVATQTVSMNIAQSPSIDNISVSNCATPLSLTVSASGGTGTYLYSIDGGTTYVDNGGVFNNVASGSYTVAIIDTNGCTDTDTVEVHPVLEADVSLTKLLDCSTPQDAGITIEVTQGSNNYDYEISDGTGTVVARTNLPSNPYVFNTLIPEDYTITIYDNSTSSPECSRVFTVTVPPAVVPVLSIDAYTNATCFGVADGTIAVSAEDSGIGPFTFEIISGPGSGATFPISASSNTDVTAVFNGLEGAVAPGITYTIRATAANGCFEDITQVILEPEAIGNVIASVQEFVCTTGNNGNSATITIDETLITGGSSSYVRYEFIEEDDPNTATVEAPVVVQNGTNPVYTETDIAGGSYTINVYDSNGCMGTTTATIEPFDELISATANITNTVTCNPGFDGELTVNVTSTLGDSSKFEYSIDNGTTYQASNVFPGLVPGAYTILIRHVDTGCVISATQTLLEPNTFTIDVVKTSDVVCYGTATGAVNFELVDATYPGGFTWTIYDTNGTLANTGDDTVVTSGTEATNGPTADISLPAGSYYVSVVQDNNPFCTNKEAFSINGPTADITGATVVTDITCVPGNDGSITITNVTGGWGGYTYYVGVGAPATIDFVSDASFTGLLAGTYQAWARDSAGCERLIQDNIVLDVPAPIAATLQIKQENCTNLEGEIEVSLPTGGQGSNYTYQLILNGSDFRAPQNTRVFSGLGAGSYAVRVTDQWGCSFTTPAELLYEEMNLTATVVKTIDCTVNSGGEITINVNGGSTNLEYTVTYPDGTTTATNTDGIFTNLDQSGLYSFLVRDLDTDSPICERTITQRLEDPVLPVLLNATVTDVSCFGGSDGSITATLDPATNTDPDYEYELYAISDLVNPIAGPQNSPLFSNLAAGEYQVKVISAKGCEATKNETVNEPQELRINATATAFDCAADNSVNTATITVNVLDGATTPGVSSGTGPYLFSLDNSTYQSSNTFNIVDDGSVQTITVYAKDDNGCTTTDTVTIQPINKFTATIATDVEISCTYAETITITVNDNGLAHNYSYELLPIGNTNATLQGTTANTATFDLLTTGSYTFRVTDTDTGCYFDTPAYDVEPFDFIEATAVATTPVTCYGDNNGALSIDIDGYSGSYQYEVLDNAGNIVIPATAADTSVNPRTIGGLTGGSYFVRITETSVPLCSEDTNMVTIVSPDMPLSATVTPEEEATCTDDKGEILVEVTGGYAPYDIELTNTTTGQNYSFTDVQSMLFTNLSAGDFTVEVTDSVGCLVSYNETLVAATPIIANATPLVTNLACYGDTGATVSAVVTSGGSGSYQYQLNQYDATGTTITSTTGAQFSPDFNDLGAGIYSVTVIDGWDCDVTTNTVEIIEPTLVQAQLIRTDPLTCATGVEFELSATGGSGSYEYSTDNVVFLPMTSNPMPLPETGVLSAGTYQYYVRDTNGCEAVLSNAITEDMIDPLDLEVDLSAAVINCNGESTASIYAEASGGLGNYEYELYTDASLSAASRIYGPQTRGEFRNLPAGTYYVSVTSEDCTTLPEEVIITEPTPLSYTEDIVNVTCAGEGNGSITVTLSGGSGGYQYAISPNLSQFDTINTFTDLEPGDYTIIAQDKNGCFEYLTYTITEPSALMVEAEVTPEICVDSQDGTITLNITGGTAPYSTALNSNDDADFVQDRLSFMNMAAGNYLLFVRDANGCETNVVVDIDTGVNLNATIEPVYECTGDVPNNYINITLEDESVIGDVLYALDSVDPSAMQLNPDFTNIAPGNHYIAIAHSNGCLVTIDFSIEAFDPLTLGLEQQNLNEITANALGGRPEYTYYFDGIDNGNDNTFFISRTDTYEVRVVDENGCETIASIYMEFIDIEIPNFFTPDGDGNNDLWIPRNMEQYPEILIKIFDRYGRVVSEQSYDAAGWDGKYDGKELPTGDYWYVIQLNGETDEREFVGHFTLYR